MARKSRKLPKITKNCFVLNIYGITHTPIEILFEGIDLSAFEFHDFSNKEKKNNINTDYYFISPEYFMNVKEALDLKTRIEERFKELGILYRMNVSQEFHLK